jgi:hypothetical protein
MQGQAPKKERALVWQITSSAECFACSECSWVLPNPKNRKAQEREIAEVQRYFAEHVCSSHLPLKKFNWG